MIRSSSYNHVPFRHDVQFFALIEFFRSLVYVLPERIETTLFQASYSCPLALSLMLFLPSHDSAWLAIALGVAVRGIGVAALDTVSFCIAIPSVRSASHLHL